MLEPEEVAAALPDSDKTLRIEAFVPCSEINNVYLDKPYYLAPDRMGADAYRLLRDGMRQGKVAAIARTVLFRRLRTVLIRAHGNGLIGTTLNFDYEVRSSGEAFEEIPDMKIEGEMLELAKHIIGTKKGSFDAKTFDDRYDAAVAELVKAKIEGRALPKKKAPSASKPSDLLQALRRVPDWDRPKNRTAARRKPIPVQNKGSGSPARNERLDRRTVWRRAPIGQAI